MKTNPKKANGHQPQSASKLDAQQILAFVTQVLTLTNRVIDFVDKCGGLF